MVPYFLFSGFKLEVMIDTRGFSHLGFLCKNLHVDLYFFAFYFLHLLLSLLLFERIKSSMLIYYIVDLKL